MSAMYVCAFTFSEGEEAIKTRVLLLQLLQNCFSMLPSLTESQSSDITASASASPSASTDVDPAEAVGELYSHLCQGKTRILLCMTQQHDCGKSRHTLFVCNALLLCRCIYSLICVRGELRETSCENKQ